MVGSSTATSYFSPPCVSGDGGVGDGDGDGGGGGGGDDCDVGS
jgi:hypothetical protein